MERKNAAPPAKPLTKRQRELLELNEKHWIVDCPREWCRAKAGEPCQSGMGNITHPHVSRQELARTVRLDTYRALEPSSRLDSRVVRVPQLPLTGSGV